MHLISHLIVGWKVGCFHLIVGWKVGYIRHCIWLHVGCCQVIIGCIRFPSYHLGQMQLIFTRLASDFKKIPSDMHLIFGPGKCTTVVFIWFLYVWWPFLPPSLSDLPTWFSSDFYLIFIWLSDAIWLHLIWFFSSDLLVKLNVNHYPSMTFHILMQKFDN